MIKLHVTCCKKIGLPNYSSIGATVGLSEIEVDDATHKDPAAFERLRRHYQTIVNQAVDDELMRMKPAQAGPSEQPPRKPEPAASPDPAPARPARGTPKPDPEFSEFEEPPNVQAEEEDDGPDPQTGGQLLGWARKQSPDPKGFIFGLGKKLKFPSKVIEWNSEQVTIVYRAAKKELAKRK
jgi:hypothetical protein